MINVNYLMLEKMVNSIESLIDRIVFVGGVTTFLYLTEQFDDIRVTVDVDVIIDANVREYQKTESALRRLGFTPDPELHCRYTKGDLILDLMPIDGKILGFSNSWYQEGIKESIVHKIGSLKIKLLSLEYFFATKIEAFLGRGQGDFYGSKDIEDIVTVLAGRADSLVELQLKEGKVIQYIKDQFGNFVKQSEFRQAMQGHLPRRSAISAAQLLTDLSYFASK